MLNPDIRAVFIMARCRVVDWSPVAKTGFWYMNITSLIGREPNRYRLTSRLGFRNSLEWKGGGGRACITLVRCMWAGVFLQVTLEVLSVTYNCTHENQLWVLDLLGAPGGCLKVVQLESLIFTTGGLLVGTGSESWVFYCWANRSFSIKNAVFEHKAVDTVSHGWWSEFVIRTVSSY